MLFAEVILVYRQQFGTAVKSVLPSGSGSRISSGLRQTLSLAEWFVPARAVPGARSQGVRGMGQPKESGQRHGCRAHSCVSPELGFSQFISLQQVCVVR